MSLAVPFTSAGTTNALLDAKTLTKTLMNSSSIEQAFDTYYQERYSDLTNHLEQGRLLKTIFLEPENTAKEAILANDKD
jgi:2-polyprenyl-6-methoxyphenol hydroxylase-like FAD-dependent oxidoreductase